MRFAHEPACGDEMDQPITSDIFINNFYPKHDAIHVEDKDDKWGVIISRDKNGEVSVTVVDKVEDTRVDLTLGSEGYTQKC